MYCHYDTLALSHSSSSSSFTTDSAFFVAEQLEAYMSPLNITLLSIGDAFPLRTLFLANIEWILPILTHLNLCSSRSVRQLVFNINEKLLNPYIIECTRAAAATPGQN